MKQSEVNPLIISAWLDWKKKNPDKKEGKFMFFLQLESNNSYLLNFKCSGNKWQYINGLLGKY